MKEYTKPMLNYLEIRAEERLAGCSETGSCYETIAQVSYS